jgi:multisubunit Na+/H+ antiporter MnhF subunit
VNVWLAAAVALLPGLLACGVVCVRADTMAALVALELAGALGAVECLLIAQGTARQPFVDLALVLAVMACIGSLAFARLLEREL